MCNLIQTLMDYSTDIYPVHYLYEVDQLLRVLRRDGDTKMVSELEVWKDRMWDYVNAEFSEPQKALSDYD